MKTLNVICSVLIFVGISSTSLAQNSGKKMDTRTSHLTEQQRAELKSTTAPYRAEMAKVKNDASLTDQQKEDSIKAIRKEMRMKVQTIVKRVEKTPEQRAKIAVNKLSEQVQLTADQKTKIEPIFVNMFADRSKVQNDNSLDEQAKKDALKKVNQTYRKQIAKILTPQQRQTLKNIKQQHKAEKANRQSK